MAIKAKGEPLESLCPAGRGKPHENAVCGYPAKCKKQKPRKG